MIKEAAGYGKGKRGKNLNFFSKHHYVSGLASEVFYLLDNTLSVGVFTVTTRRSGSREKMSRGLF